MTTTAPEPIRLADLYDADRRNTSPEVRAVAAVVPIPHPLPGVTYAEGRYDRTGGTR